uniref:Uncharacterized protein n=1 Tax=Palpitomonas bilix TaxID=652834 RepID=A0A7S3D4N0_9EUKA|mmetsp:Transcript_21577/g.56036  ORF Transcript_21577/g.56036 Transcript_21577/m.56036 type:complete len:195 (+) Transcript_21577:194-778(+)
MNLFGKKKKQAAPNATDAVQKLKDTQELLEKREAHLEQKINEELLKAKKLSKMKNKRGALMALKRKKMMEAQVDKLGATKMNLETQISALQNASMDMEVIQAMRSGASAMKVQYQNMNVENVEDVMDEIRDQMDVANEVSEAISQPLGGEMIDEVRCHLLAPVLSVTPLTACAVLTVSPFSTPSLSVRMTFWES